jgi:FAD/FMN-containing dehydrogenase
MNFSSWGIRSDRAVRSVEFDPGKFSFQGQQKYLTYGRGRSYGDVCLAHEKTIVITTNSWNRIVSFDEENGKITCQSGTTLEEILNLIIPRGWFLTVTPGTKHITVGGAIANDVHGKNHFSKGSFCNHVESITLLRTSGDRVVCSLHQNNELMRATMGGLGLTGFIEEVTFNLTRIPGTTIQTRLIPFFGIDEYFELTNEYSDRGYLVSWFELFRQSARGIIQVGDFEKTGEYKVDPIRSLSIPFKSLELLLNPKLVRLFNSAYFNKKRYGPRNTSQSYDQFFYPLDSMKKWNLIYGNDGLIQFQSVLPPENAKYILREMFKVMTSFKCCSYLGVLKELGKMKAKGFLSFPREGTTVAMDFPRKNSKSTELVKSLNQIAVDGGGAIYPAKDALMTRKQFEICFPDYEMFLRYKDSSFTSLFWERIE